MQGNARQATAVRAESDEDDGLVLARRAVHRNQLDPGEPSGDAANTGRKLAKPGHTVANDAVSAVTVSVRPGHAKRHVPELELADGEKIGFIDDARVQERPWHGCCPLSRGSAQCRSGVAGVRDLDARGNLSLVADLDADVEMRERRRRCLMTWMESGGS
jgi:hypothetical protein